MYERDVRCFTNKEYLPLVILLSCAYFFVRLNCLESLPKGMYKVLCYQRVDAYAMHVNMRFINQRIIYRRRIHTHIYHVYNMPWLTFACWQFAPFAQRLSTVAYMYSVAGNRTPVSRVTGGNTGHYTTTDEHVCDHNSNTMTHFIPFPTYLILLHVDSWVCNQHISFLRSCYHQTLVLHSTLLHWNTLPLS